MNRVGDRPQKAYANRLDLKLTQAIDNFSQPCLVEWTDDFPRCAYSLWRLEGKRSRNIGAGELLRVVVGVQPATLTQQKYVTVALGGQECRSRSVPGQESVCRSRCCMDENPALS